MSQFDFKAGTSGEGACILSGKDNPAKPVIKSDIGLLIDPIIGVLVLYSKTIVVNVIPHAKNSNDSYKLLNGK
jgi:hypothetical protein